MTGMIEITVQTVGGPLRARRNMFRFPGLPLSVKVLDGENEIILTRVEENDFDERDITVMGTPTEYCILAPGLAVVWPTAANAVILDIKTEV